jgi:hypothetical protein
MCTCASPTGSRTRTSTTAEDVECLARLTIAETIRVYGTLRALADECQSTVERHDEDPDDELRTWTGIAFGMLGKIEDTLAEAIGLRGDGRSARGIVHEGSLYASTPDDEGVMRLTVVELGNGATLDGELLS